jgi:hypothetical protein
MDEYESSLSVLFFINNISFRLFQHLLNRYYIFEDLYFSVDMNRPYQLVYNFMVG